MPRQYYVGMKFTFGRALQLHHVSGGLDDHFVHVFQFYELRSRGIFRRVVVADFSRVVDRLSVFRLDPGVLIARVDVCNKTANKRVTIHNDIVSASNGLFFMSGMK